MKKNTKTYLLLFAVLAIWGTIGYRIIASIASDPEPVASTTVVAFTPLPVKEKDTFSIVADYRDPFLGTLPQKKVSKTKTKARPKRPAAPEIPIAYTGFITDNSTDQKIFFVTINGQQYLMRPQDEIDKVKLLGGSETTIRVRYDNKTKTISRSQ